MSILSRFATIVKSNINELLDRAEDPEKMVDQMLRDLREDFAEVKKETAGVMADARSAQREVEACEADIAKYETSARNALKSGNEEDAKILIARKQEKETQLVTLRKNEEIAQANAAKMRQMHDKLKADIETLETRKSTIKATEAMAKAQERMNDITSGGDKAASSLEAFDRMEQKANRHLDEAMSEAELSLDGDSADDLADKYASGGSSASVDDELAAMKAELGL